MDIFEKQPREIDDYVVDVTKHINYLGGDDIQSVTMEVDGTGVAPDLVLGPGALPESQLIGSPTRKFKVWVGDGQDGTTYRVTALIDMESGRRIEHDFLVKVKAQ